MFQLLQGLGLEGFRLRASSILPARSQISMLSVVEMKSLAAKEVPTIFAGF
ncbi:hypothetical protein NYE80_07705 [Paenibacillus sp. FSL H7-0357]|uniref:hypothetical protein n=1 Tax=Paenibacillus sp. FSL H7-0357 TaxID=1536774 RepID=UPI000A495F21